MHRCALALQLLFLLLRMPLLRAQGPNLGAAPGAVWASFGGGPAGGGRAVVGGIVGPTAIQPLSAQAWSSWSGTSAASLAAGPNGVLIYYTQGGMAPIGSIVRGCAATLCCIAQLFCAACACNCLCCCYAHAAFAPSPLPQLIRDHVLPPTMQVSILPGQYISTQALRHCNYQMSFCANTAANNDFRHTVNYALNGQPPPQYSFQSVNYPGNWISTIAGSKIMFCPGGLFCDSAWQASDASWLLAPTVANAPANFTFRSASTNPAYAGTYLSACSGSSWRLRRARCPPTAARPRSPLPGVFSPFLQPRARATLRCAPTPHQWAMRCRT